MSSGARILLTLIHIAIIVLAVYLGYKKSENQSTGTRVLYILLALILGGIILIPINLLFML